MSNIPDEHDSGLLDPVRTPMPPGDHEGGPGFRFLRPFVTPLLFRDGDAPTTTFGAVAQIDIGGFTRAVEEYSEQGSRALEALATLIGGCFDVLVGTVNRYGGAVHTFPGDGVVAVWEAPEDGLYDVVRSARECARELAGSFPTARRFSLKAGVGAGPLTILALGEPGSRREVLVTGSAMSDAAAALRRASGGQTVLAPSAERFAPHGRKDRNALSLTGYATRAPISVITATRDVGTFEVASLLDFMPRLVRERLQSGIDAWIGEFRNVSTIFAEIGAGEPATFDSTRKAYALMQECMKQYGGTIVQFCHDDKGLVSVMAFGAETSHEDDPNRALLASFSLREGLAAIGLDSAIGVSTGRVFSGLLGGQARMEFRLIGRVVNHAARLMNARQAILCDGATKDLATEFHFAAPVTLTDRKGRLSAQKPLARSTRTWMLPACFRRSESEIPVCGRTSEIARAEAWLAQLESLPRTSSRTLALVGEAGIGKTRLATHLAHKAETSGLRVVASQNQEAGPKVGLYAFRPILEQLFDLGERTPEDGKRLLREAVVSATGSSDLAPLLNDLYPLGVPDNPVTSGLSGADRAANRLALLARLLQASTNPTSPLDRATLVFLEDAHWMDPASWTLLNVLCSASEARIYFVLTLRPLPDASQRVAALVGSGRAQTLELGPLGRSDTAKLVAAYLGVNQATPQLVAMVERRSEGNPLFSREIVRSLLDRSLIVVTGRTARLAGSVSPAASVVPDSIEKLVRARLDRLSVRRQWLLKCASVIGLRFEQSLLESFPDAAPLGRLEEDLAALVDEELIERCAEQNSPMFAFRHTTIRDVVYATLLFEQRRNLHIAVAMALEAGPEADEQALIIFDHWRSAGEGWRALRYVARDGEKALRGGDYYAAREYFAYGVSALAGIDDENEQRRRAHWNQKLGEALVALGRHEQARVHLEAALRNLGETVPRSRIAVSLRTVIEFAWQWRRRRFGVPWKARAPDDSMSERAEIYEQLGYVFYASGDTLRGIHAAFGMLNRAEQGTADAVRARAYAAMGLTASVTPLRRLAEHYETAAYRTATSVDDRAVSGWVEWIASLRAAGEGRWPDVLEKTDRAIDTGRVGTASRLVVMASLTRAWALRVQGELGEAMELAALALQLGRGHGNHLWEAWAHLIEAECHLARRAYEATIRCSQRALAILLEESDRTEEARARGLMAAALFAQGQERKALLAAAECERVLRKLDLTSFLMLEGFAGVAEVHVTRCELAAEQEMGRAPRRLMRKAQSACQGLNRFARVFPVAKPRALQMQARLEIAAGRQRAAMKSFAQALQVAEQLDMPRESSLVSQVLERNYLTFPQEMRRGTDRARRTRGSNQTGST